MRGRSTSERRSPRSLAGSTAIFSGLTGLSRLAGLAREVLAASYFCTTAAASAFTIAFLIPNVRALSVCRLGPRCAAFVPVFTELLEERRKGDAFRLASALLMIMSAILGALTALFVLSAGALVRVLPLGALEADGLSGLTVGLSQVMFPIVLILGLNGLTVGHPSGP